MEKPKKEEIGQRIKEIRKATGATQGEFAEKLGMTSSGLSQVENGIIAPSLDLIMGLVKEYKQSYSWIIDGIRESVNVPYVNSNDPLAVQCNNLLFGLIIPTKDKISRVEAYLSSKMKLSSKEITSMTAQKMERSWQTLIKQYFTEQETPQDIDHDSIVFEKYRQLFNVYLSFYKDRLITLYDLMFSGLTKAGERPKNTPLDITAIVESILNEKAH